MDLESEGAGFKDNHYWGPLTCSQKEVNWLAQGTLLSFKRKLDTIIMLHTKIPEVKATMGKDPELGFGMYCGQQSEFGGFQANQGVAGWAWAH